MRLLSVVFLFLILTSLFACRGVAVRAPLTGEQMANKDAWNSIALVYGTGEDEYPYCSGSWVSEYSILTAAHCMAGIAEKVRSERVTTGDFAAPEVDPMTLELNYVVQNDVDDPFKPVKRSYIAKLVAMSPERDLALVRVVGAHPVHGWAFLAKTTPEVGSVVSSSGTVKGLYWSYRQGVVSAYREDMSQKIKGPFLQVSMAISHGDSGSGIFNEYGELIGVTSFATNAPNSGFCIHLKTIRGFLIGQRVLQAEL